MAKSVKTGGRQPGTPNKKTKELAQKCEELGVDPFEILLRFAKGDWEGLGYDSKEKVVSVTKDGNEIFGEVISPETRSRCAMEASSYLYPKRKSVELSNKDDEGFRVVVEDYASDK